MLTVSVEILALCLMLVFVFTSAVWSAAIWFLLAERRRADSYQEQMFQAAMIQLKQSQLTAFDAIKAVNMNEFLAADARRKQHDVEKAWLDAQVAKELEEAENPPVPEPKLAKAVGVDGKVKEIDMNDYVIA